MSALVFSIGVFTGGTDIIAMILHKYISLEINRALQQADIEVLARRETLAATGDEMQKKIEEMLVDWEATRNS